ncbi:hypothetical protein QYE76_033132 [Lolium multiflorum]|uniref:Retrotransposon gag domain-containing protein n=1 Tax=Lolium multiflorum TaxID=4521 RepID=A0AAD8QX01_LOLMU|nr:hypothetical protein QYE76_033132 [Lolium multiflorum]
MSRGDRLGTLQDDRLVMHVAGSDNRFRLFVNSLLLHRDNTTLPLRSFEIDAYLMTARGNVFDPHVEQWITHAVSSCRARLLTARFLDEDTMWSPRHRRPFASPHLTMMHLHCVKLAEGLLDFSCCPELLHLRLTECRFVAGAFVSPSLEHLSIIGCDIRIRRNADGRNLTKGFEMVPYIHQVKDFDTQRVGEAAAADSALFALVRLAMDISPSRLLCIPDRALPLTCPCTLKDFNFCVLLLRSAGVSPDLTLSPPRRRHSPPSPGSSPPHRPPSLPYRPPSSAAVAEDAAGQSPCDDGGSQKGRRGEPRWAQTTGRRGPWPGRATRGVGPHSPFASFSSRTPSSRNLSHEGTSRRVTAASGGGGHQREKSSPAGRNPPGNSLPEGEIDAIVIVIELDIISIIIIIISTIYTAITTAAPRHRCISMNEVRKKLFTISLSGKAAHWYKLLKNGDSIDWEDIVPLFYSKFYPPSEIHKDRNRIYNFWPHDGESIAQAWGRLKSLMLKCPIHELPGNVIIDNFYARLSFQDKTLLDTSCSGSFTRNKEEFKRDLLDRIQENTEGWENDKDRESGIIYDYKCIEAFMDTDKFRNMSATYGLDSQVVANLYKAFASHYELPKKNFDKYHEPYKDKVDSSVNKCVVIETVDNVIPEAYIEKTPFPAKMKEYSVISSAVNKSEKKPKEPEEQIKIEPVVAIVKDLVTENVEDGHIIFCEDASNIVSHPNKPKQVSVPMLSVRIGDHCYYGLCDIGASVSAIPYELYTEIMHEIGSCELEDIDVVIHLANRETISPIGIVRDVEVLCGKIKYPADFLVLGSAASDHCPIIFGRPFLNTCGAIIDCKKEKILTRFAGEPYEFNFSKFTKTPYKADLPSNDFKMEQCASIVLVPNNPLQQHLENSESEAFRKERDELEEIFLRQPILKHDLPVEDLGTTPPPKEDPVFDLKPLPDNLKYAHIDDKKIYPVIIGSKLSEIEEERLLEILKKHRGAIGYTLDDLKGISPSICQHAINMEDDAKPVVEHQHRLIPKMKEVVRNEVLKLLEAGIIYPIADSRWVSPVHCVPKKGGMTVVPNDNDELIPQRIVVGTMVSNNKDTGPLKEDIQDPELKEEDASEDEEEVEEAPRVHQRATVASIGVISNPSNTKRSARIATGGAVPRHYLAPRTSSPSNYNPYRNLIYDRQTERTPKVVLPSGWDIDRSNIAGEMKSEAEGWGNNSRSWDSPPDMIMSRVEHNSDLIRNLTYEIEDLKELVKKLVERNPSPSSPKE